MSLRKGWRCLAGLAVVFSAHAALPNKTLIYCSEGSPAGFDPGRYTSSIEYSAAARTIYNRLAEFEFERGGIKIKPSLATAWDISPDGLVYTFHLRRGVKFHTTPWFKPTRAFNANDVLFTFERMRRDPKMPFSAYFGSIIEEIKTPDPYTVRFILKTADAPFLSNLAVLPASILSSEYAAQLLKKGTPTRINWKPVGTGPFIFEEYVKDAAIYFKGNPGYWKPADVRLAKLIFTITPDATVRAQKLKANECQVGVYPRPADIPALQADPNLKVLNQPGFMLSHLAYNVTHKPLHDVRVRRALDMTIDKKAIIKAVYGDRAQTAVAPMPPLQWSYDRTLKDAPHNLQQARALLAQAGYPRGFSISLWAMPIQRPYNPNARLMAEMIQADWKKIGVKAKIVSYEWGEYLRRGYSGQHDAILIGSLADTGDPQNWLGMLRCRNVHGFNLSNWCFKPFENLLQQAGQTTDIVKRTRLYIQAQRIFKREQPLTPIAYPTVYQPISKQVVNFNIDPLGSTWFAGVGLE